MHSAAITIMLVTCTYIHLIITSLYEWNSYRPSITSCLSRHHVAWIFRNSAMTMTSIGVCKQIAMWCRVRQGRSNAQEVN